MEIDFQSFCVVNEQLKNIARRIDSKIEALDFVLSRLNWMHELNEERATVKKALEELVSEKRNLLILADVVEKVSYRYMRCEKKILAKSEEYPFNLDVSLVRYSADNNVNLFLNQNKINISVDDDATGRV